MVTRPCLGLLLVLLPTGGCWADADAPPQPQPWYAGITGAVSQALQASNPLQWSLPRWNVMDTISDIKNTTQAGATLVADRSPCGGATDECTSVATAVCRAHGFGSGKPIETVTYEVCSGYFTSDKTCKTKRRLDRAACWGTVN